MREKQHVHFEPHQSEAIYFQWLLRGNKLLAEVYYHLLNLDHVSRSLEIKYHSYLERMEVNCK